MRLFLRLLALLAVVAATLSPASLRAAREEVPLDPAAAALELVVVETQACGLCRLFRDTVVPAYKLSPRAQDTTLRFVDINQFNPRDLDLQEPIEIVPTVVLMREGRELGRITGYTGPELFMRAVVQLLENNQ